jgi:hypothetical protein
VFEPTAIIIGSDNSQLKITPSSFSIERKLEAPFVENTYFSQAPLETSEHLQLVEEIERGLSA